MKLKTLTSVEIQDKIILLRTDLNVPIQDGVITELTRIMSSIPTINTLLQNGAKQIHILAHLGRPKGEVNPKYSLQIVADKLSELLVQDVLFAESFNTDTNGAKIILHENIRFYPGEKKNDPDFADMILTNTGAKIFVNDGFGVSHRAHASVVGFEGKIPCVAGKLIEKEITHLSPLLSDQKMEGLTVLVGGAKMETKVAVLKHFAKTASNICVGGALANTFLAAEGYDVGQSLYEESELETAREVLMTAEKHGTGFHVPVDVICAEAPDAAALDFPIEDVMGTLKIFDLGSHTIDSYSEIIKHSKTVIWNGPFGLYEYDAFANGTKDTAKLLSKLPEVDTILGGGDTLDALKKFNISQENFTHVSTGGGAMLEFLEGKELPGIEILKN